MKDKQLKELCERAGMECSLGHWYIEDEHLKRFAELVRQDEREACAALVEADGRVHEKAPDFVWRQTIAKLIIARGNHD